MSEVLDNDGTPLLGPVSLDEALAAAEPCSSTGTRMAVSKPEGAWIAIRMPSNDPGSGMEYGLTLFRCVNEISGHGGSRMGTGRWGVPPRNLEWRPA